MTNSEVCKVKIELEYKGFKLLVTYDKSTKRYFGYLQGLAKSKTLESLHLDSLQSYLTQYIDHNTKSEDKPELVVYRNQAMAIIYCKDSVVGLAESPNPDEFDFPGADCITLCLLDTSIIIKRKTLQEVIDKHREEIDLYFECTKY